MGGRVTATSAAERTIAAAQVQRIDRLVTSLRTYGQGSVEWHQCQEQLDIALRDGLPVILEALREAAGMPPRSEPFPEQNMVTTRKTVYDPTPVAEHADRMAAVEQRVLDHQDERTRELERGTAER